MFYSIWGSLDSKCSKGSTFICMTGITVFGCMFYIGVGIVCMWSGTMKSKTRWPGTMNSLSSGSRILPNHMPMN